MRILEYLKPKDIQEAYEILNGRDKAELIAGGLFLRFQKRNISIGVDLTDLNLSYIKEEENLFKIGAMTTLREIETSNLPKALKDSVKQISGIGVRNMATVGGSVFGRYAFSDINTALLALNTKLVFHKHGEISLEQFLKNKLNNRKDILKEIIVLKPELSEFRCVKQVYTDFSLINLCISKKADKYQLSIGSRPKRCELIVLENLNDLDYILSKFEFGDDFKAKGIYRKALAYSLMEDILEDWSE